MVRQVEHRARPECHYDLALTHLPGGFLVLGFGETHGCSSGSISMSSIVRSQRFTLGSTSRIERFARNFLCRGCIVFSSGSRKSCSKGFAAPISDGLYCRAVPLSW